MENSQITGEELLKGGQYFEKTVKKKGVVLVLEISLGLKDPIHIAFQSIQS